MAERVVDSDARAHERPGFFRRQFIGNHGQHRRRCDQVLGISAIEIDAGDFAIDAHGEIAAPALFAHETMSSMPAHADALTFAPSRDVAADRIDAARDLMTRHPGKLKPRPQTLFNEHIAVANATRLHFHANLPGAWLRDFAFHQFPIPARFADLRRLHFHICPSSPCFLSPLTFVT